MYFHLVFSFSPHYFYSLHVHQWPDFLNFRVTCSFLLYYKVISFSSFFLWSHPILVIPFICLSVCLFVCLCVSNLQERKKNFNLDLGMISRSQIFEIELCWKVFTLVGAFTNQNYDIMLWAHFNSWCHLRGKTILADSHSSWCTTVQKNMAVIDSEVQFDALPWIAEGYNLVNAKLVFYLKLSAKWSKSYYFPFFQLFFVRYLLNFCRNKKSRI